MRRSLMLVVVAASATAGIASEPAFVPVASIKQLHDTLITPASDALFDVEVSPPQDAAAWDAVSNSAVVLAESANLLMLKGRARDNAEWMALSRGLLDAAVAAQRAATARQHDALVAANGRTVEVCQNRRKPYRDGGHNMMMGK